LPALLLLLLDEGGGICVERGVVVIVSGAI
jgi:hypothetical protein